MSDNPFLEQRLQGGMPGTPFLEQGQRLQRWDAKQSISGIGNRGYICGMPGTPFLEQGTEVTLVGCHCQALHSCNSVQRSQRNTWEGEDERCHLGDA